MWQVEDISRLAIPPRPEELELTLFGPGYGESIVLHIPGLGWGVVDSCSWRPLGQPAKTPPLEYLRLLSVDSLFFIILTHPHEDHYQGMAEILRAYRGRIRYVSRYHGEGVRELKVYLARQRLTGRSGMASLGEVFTAMEEAKEGGAYELRLSEMTQIIAHQNLQVGESPIFGVQIVALSPSAESGERYTNLLRQSIPNVGERVLPLKDELHNYIASAISLAAGQVRVILGSDLESGATDRMGWRGVLSNPDRHNLSADLVKVAHHGSRNAHFQGAWQLHGEGGLPLAVLTPWDRGAKPLPQESDIQRLKGVSAQVGQIAALRPQRSEDVYSREVAKTLRTAARNWRVITPAHQEGALRIRFRLDGTIVNQIAFPPAFWHS
jgi:beta-lactamase superfamily II metal-dependent hydrolase